MAASRAPASFACDGFGFAATRSPATFDIFHWVQVANYGLFYILFDSAPSGSNHIDVWDVSLHLQIVSAYYFVAPF